MNRSWYLLQWTAVGLLVFTLPFSSFPLVARLTGSGMVAPLALLPLLVLLFVWLLPYLLRRGTLPPQLRILLAFVLVALLSMAAAFFLPIPPFRDQSILSKEIEALATLVIGICFYTVLAVWPAEPADRLRFVLRWINWGGALQLGWVLFQAFVWYRFGSYPEWMWNFQGQVSTSLLLYGPRVNGFAYEPSWLAHQLNMLYLPFWLACSVTGFTAHRWHLGKLHIEHVLLVGGLVSLVLSVSRIGQLTFFVMVAYLILLLNLWLVGWAQARFLSRARIAENKVVLVRRLFVLMSLLILVVVYAGLLLGVGYGLSKYDPRMAKLFDFSALQQGSILYYANQLVFAERIVFWEAGWNIFNDYPILGVGLGNAGFFFPQKLSAFSYALTEVRQLVYQWSALPNIKNLWVRLLAETGLVGFAFFSGWCYILWKSARFLSTVNERMMKMFGLAGTLVLIGFLVEGFSLDTFALPYYWVSFGLITAACSQVRRRYE